MPRAFSLKPADKAVKAYYEALQQDHHLGVAHELGVRYAFEALLESSARRFAGWNLVREFTLKRGTRTIRPDGILLDEFRLSRGCYEAKGGAADLEKEARTKIAQGYPAQNTLFWQPGRILLYQNAAPLEFDIRDAARLVDALRVFFNHEEPELERWEEAVREFKDRVPELANSLLSLIREEERLNSRFRKAFADFFELCRTSINPNLSEAAVEEMLIQHLLTERIFRRVFDHPDFTRRNVVAAKIENVIDALTSQSFSRQEFLKSLDPFYGAIESTAATIEDYTQKQEFLNTVYEQFFQGFSVRIADTHGIVYTPQSIVDFIVESVDRLLRDELGTHLAAPGVHILDPFVGTGNFLIRVLHKIAETKKTTLPEKYSKELHANEVMLLPYYIASMNIEHTYLELTGRYQAFEGICLVDTFELAEDKQLGLFTEANTERVERQKEAPIRVVIGNPPYNVGQLDENDNNKNRKYPAIDGRVRDTYAKDSHASSTSKLNDPYIKALRWASDRIGTEGMVAFVCNSKFIEGLATDGVRKHLEEDFDRIYILDLGGNVRKNRKLSGTTHNVFGIQVGVSINLLVRRRERSERAEISYFKVQDDWTKERKYRFLGEVGNAASISWQRLHPDEGSHNWLTEGEASDFDSLVPLGSKETQRLRKPEGVIFRYYSLGVTTARDAWAYNFDRNTLANNMSRMIETYNDHVRRWPAASRKGAVIGEWIEADGSKISWSRDLKADLEKGVLAKFDPEKIRSALYRPYARRLLYFDRIVNEEVRLFDRIVPTAEVEDDNRIIACTGPGSEKPFMALMAHEVFDYHVVGAGATAQGFPFYVYSKDGINRLENVTDWALELFQDHYGDQSIKKWDIFHYVYAVLHHPTFTQRYAVNLRKELPRVPLAPEFWPFVEAGARLADLHTNYELQSEFQLVERWEPGLQLDLRVERMRYDAEGGCIAYNDALTLEGIPREVEHYIVGQRSALAWVVDQYRVVRDRRSEIVSDPNREDDPKAVLRLIGQVITVSLETARIIHGMPDLGVNADE